MQKSVVQSIKSLCGGGRGRTPISKVPSSVIESAVFFVNHIPSSFPPPTPSLIPPDKLVLEWWCGRSSYVKIIFAEKTPPTYEVKTNTRACSGKMMPPSEFSKLLSEALQNRTSKAKV
jgi:hypothetical protein